MSQLLLKTIERLVGASLNHHKRMKAEPSRQIPEAGHKATSLSIYKEYETSVLLMRRISEVSK